MDTPDSYQVVDVLMLVANVAPVALYFLVLGLVNSHARPYLITSRSDFIVLTSVLVPVLLWPVPGFVQAGSFALLAIGLLLAVGVFVFLLPRPNAGFVVYNISESRCMRLLNDSLRSLSRRGHWDGRTWRSLSGHTSIHIAKFALLRNVTLHIEGAPDDRFADELGAELRGRLGTVFQLPSPMGACLVLIGVGMMIVPMWLVGRHIDDLVDAMSHLFG